MWGGACPLGDGEDLAPHPEEDLEIEDDNDIYDDASGLFGIDLNDGNQPIKLDDNDGDGGVAASTDTLGIPATTTSGKRVSTIWEYSTEIKEDNI